MNERCAFCERVKAKYEYVAEENLKNKTFKIKRKKEYCECTVALITHYWFHGNKRNASRITDYRYMGKGYALNFCPVCGRKLKEKN